MEVRRATITAVGHYVPEKILTNADLEKMVDTNDEWIRTRTGIRERHILEQGATSDLAVKAVQQVLAHRGITAKEIDLIIVATITPDMMLPATACVVQDKIGASKAWGFDLNAACSGFLYAVSVGTRFIETGVHSKVIVVGADKMSSITDYSDRNTCVLFGDAAGALLLEPTTEAVGIMDSLLLSDGSGMPYLHMKAGGSLRPASHETVDAKEHFIYQEGQTVFKWAVSKMADVSAEMMEKHNLQPEDLAWLVPHQANMRIIDAVANRMGLEKEKVMINIERYGNTTSATIPLCLWEWEPRLRKGDNIILSAFGGGFTWGATYLKWAYDPK